MIDRGAIVAKLAELDRRVRRVEAVRQAGAAEYDRDEAATELTAFNLSSP